MRCTRVGTESYAVIEVLSIVARGISRISVFPEKSSGLRLYMMLISNQIQMSMPRQMRANGDEM